MIVRDYQANAWQVVERNFPCNMDAAQKLKFLLRYAILAPSSHNTQPWRFEISEGVIRIYINKERWLKIADADRREIYISVGCALENLLIAAEHFGYGHRLHYFPEPGNQKMIAELKLTDNGKPSAFRSPDLFNAITVRHTNHKAYEPRSISPEDQQRIQACVVEDGISLYLTGDLEIKRKIDALVNRADAIQFADPAFREELGYWIGQGVFGAPWLIAKLSQLAVSYLDLGNWTAKKDTDLLMSAPVFALLCSNEDDREAQVKVGQVFERISLKATALGIRLQPVSQILQVPEIKAKLTELLPAVKGFPQHPFRLGYADPEKHHTPRRAVEEVLA